MKNVKEVESLLPQNKEDCVSPFIKFGKIKDVTPKEESTNMISSMWIAVRIQHAC